MTSRARTALALLAAGALALTASACGEKQDQVTASAEPRKLTLMLDYLPNPDHVGLYTAIERGAFADANLEVDVQVPSDPAAPLKLVQSGKADIAISYAPEVLIARDQGAQLVSVAAIATRPLTSLVTLDRRRIRDVADLRGKRVGTAGIPYQSAYLRTILAQAGVPQDSVEEISVGFNLTPAMLSRRVDATLGAFWNVEGVQLQRRRRDPRIFRMDEVGVPTYDELVLVAHKDFVGEHGDTVRAFVQALARGYDATRSDPQAATDALVKANPDLEPSFALASVRASLPIFFPADERRPWGWQDPRAWTAYGDWMLEQELVSRPPRAGVGAITNEFLAGQSG